MSLAQWSLFIGVLLVTMVMAGTLLGRLPLNSAMVYLALGWLLGPHMLDVLRPDPYQQAATLERLAEVALLISLFAVGLRLGVPLRDRRWLLPLSLAVVSMTLMVGLVTAVGVGLLGLPLGAAVLLGAILAPTDPVLASDLSADPGPHPDRVGFSLAAEGGLNDATAYPFVLLGLGLMGLHDLGQGLSRWWTVDLLWAPLAGAAIGAALGAATGRLVVHLRSRHEEAIGRDEFLGLGVVALAFGLAQLAGASGFLSVFAAGLALQRVRERPLPDADGATMLGAVASFNAQLEKLAELALVLIVGAMLAYAKPLPAALWFVPLLMLVLRPLASLASTVGAGLTPSQRGMIGWFGIRGIGSLFYLLLALRLNVDGEVADVLVTLTLWTIATSIVAHGLTAQPLMRLYLERRRLKAARRRHQSGPPEAP
jgi:NhaP-type Na+/H+ or K+/H+ antiporter